MSSIDTGSTTAQPTPTPAANSVNVLKRQKTIPICQYMTMFQNLNIIYSTNLMIPLLTKCFFPEVNTPASHIYLEPNAEPYARYTPIPIRSISSSLLRALIAGNRLSFFKIYSHFAYFCLNFQIFYPFLPFLYFFLLFF